MSRQQGWVVLVILLLLLLGGSAALWLSSALNDQQYSLSISQRQQQAFYAASSGLEFGAHQFLHPDVEQRVDCLAMDTSIHSFPNSGASDWEYQLTPTTTNKHSERVAEDVLIQDDSIAILGNTEGFAETGLLRIDREWVYYGKKDRQRFQGLIRGFLGSERVTHERNASVNQWQCQIRSSGFVPAQSDPDHAEQTLMSMVSQPYAWSVGDAAAMAWDNHQMTWRAYNLSGGSKMRANAISVLSYDQVFAVGQYKIFYWNGERWSSQSSNIDYQDIYMNKYNDGYLVAKKFVNATTIQYWNGVVWQSVAAKYFTGSAKNVDMNGIHCTTETTNTNGYQSVCWAVGDKGTVVRKDENGNWTIINSGTNHVLNRVYCAAKDDCLIAGDKVLLQVTDASHTVPVDVSATYHYTDVSCPDSQHCWVTANQGSHGITLALTKQSDGRWGSATWDVNTHQKAKLNAIHCATRNSCWLCGDAGYLSYWNGHNWKSTQVGSSDLHDVDFMGSPSIERQIFNTH